MTEYGIDLDKIRDVLLPAELNEGFNQPMVLGRTLRRN